jgi:hypothetical protein
MKNIIPVLCVSLFLFCAPGFKYVQIGENENRILDQNWAIAQALIDYDYFSWIASDSLIKYRDKIDSKKFNGWIVDKNDLRSTVIFGNIKDNCLLSCFRVPFISTHVGPALFNDTCYSSNSNAYVGFNAMNLMRTKLKTEFDSLRVPMNSYVLFDQDTIVVYFFPGSTDKYTIVCGGYRAKFNRKTLEIIENIKLHKSPLVIEKRPRNAVGSFRTSSISEIINEVDIAQAFLLKTQMPKQYIATRKYIFIFHFDQSTGSLDFRIAKQDK